MDNPETIQIGQSRYNPERTIQRQSRMDNPETIQNGQSRDNDNIRHKRHKTKTKQRKKSYACIWVLTFGKQLHDRMNLKKRRCVGLKPFKISDWACSRVLGVSILNISTILLLDFGCSCSESEVFLCAWGIDFEFVATILRQLRKNFVILFIYRL